MRRSFAMVAAAGAVLLDLPVTAHAAEAPVHSVSLPFFWPGAELDDVAPDGAGGVWIAGGQGAYCISWIDYCALYSGGNPVVRRWTGSSWKEYPIKGWTGNGVMARVETGGGQTWIGGGAYDSSYLDQLFVFDGSAFQKVDKPSTASFGMLSVSAAGTWITQAVGPDSDQPALLRYDGSAWADMDLPDRRTIVSDVEGVSATDVWAVGRHLGDAESPQYPLVAHFDGSSWTSMPAPTFPEAVNSLGEVVPLGPDDVWVTAGEYLAHWDGTGWTVVTAPGFVADLAVDGSGTLWAATGYDGWETLHRYSGGTWQSVAVPAGTILNDITTTGASTIWGVGHANYSPVAVSNF